MDELDARLIPGTAGAPREPFFSPDGKWIGYISVGDSQLKKIPISGGPPVGLMRVAPTGFFDWGADDAIVYGGLSNRHHAGFSNGGSPKRS